MGRHPKGRASKDQFIRQQGFATADSNGTLYRALMLQPRIIGCLFVLGVLLQNPWLFLALSAVLLWSTLAPAYSPFDAIYNAAVAYPRGLPRLGPAPAPRRFAQGQAATMSLAISAALFFEFRITAWALEGLFAAALIALVFWRFCLGSSMYYRLRRLSTKRPSPPTYARQRC